MMRSSGTGKKRDRILSETEIIAEVAKLKCSRKNAIPRDDIGVFTAHGKVYAATDSLIEGVHYLEAWLSPADIAYKLFARNYSDFAVKGVRPQFALLSLALKRDHAITSFILPFLRELDRLFTHHRMTLIGGDTSRAASDHFTLAFFGNGKHFVPRRANGIREGDLVLQAGTIGGSDAARAKLVSGTGFSKALSAPFRRPQYLEVPLSLAQAKAAIDQSDSMQKTLQLLCEANNVQLEVDLETVLAAKAIGQVTNENAQQLLSAAEDLAIFCIAPGGGRVRSKSAPAFRPIGRVKYIHVRRPHVSYTLHGKPYDHPAITFEHFE